MQNVRISLVVKVCLVQGVGMLGHGKKRYPFGTLAIDSRDSRGSDPVTPHPAVGDERAQTMSA